MSELETSTETTVETGTQEQQTTTEQTTEQTTEAKSWYNDNWRDKLAESIAPGDQSFRKRLDRFNDPTGPVKSWLAAEKKISSGEYKLSQLPDNASDDQVKAWRAENGIPESPDGYDIKIPLEGEALEKAKPFLDNFYKYSHENSIPKAYAEKALNFMLENSRQMQDQLAERDKTDEQEREETLRTEWPAGDYKLNMNLMSGLFDGAEEGLKEDLFNARLPDGTKLINDPGIVKLLAGLAREVNPAATVVPAGENQTKSIQDEIASIEKVMKEDMDKYRKDTKMRDRYLQLIEARDKLSKKG